MQDTKAETNVLIVEARADEVRRLHRHEIIQRRVWNTTLLRSRYIRKLASSTQCGSAI